MVEVVLALAAIAVTAAIVIGDARPPTRRHEPPPQIPFEETPPLPTSPSIDVVDAPTESFDPDVLAEAPSPIAQTTFALPLPSSQILPTTAEPAEGTSRWQPDPERLIQTEVLIPDGGREHRTAVTRLAIGIAASGLVLGLGIMGVARAIGALVRAL